MAGGRFEFIGGDGVPLQEVPSAPCSPIPTHAPCLLQISSTTPQVGRFERDDDEHPVARMGKEPRMGCSFQDWRNFQSLVYFPSADLEV